MSDGNTCLFCKTTLHVPSGLEPTQLCNLCAQELSAQVLDDCVTGWVPIQGKTPKELLRALLAADQRVALDPAVSEAAKALVDGAAPKWIPVSERLPLIPAGSNVSVVVLATDGKNRFTAYLSRKARWFFTASLDMEFWGVTHWVALPALPSTTKEST